MTPSRAAEIDIVNQNLARPAATMAVGTALSRLTGLGRVLVMAFALGISESRLADAYNLANTLPNVLYELVLGGVLTSVFIPVLIQELRTNDRETAWTTISAIATVCIGVLLTISLVAALFAPAIVALFTGRVTAGSSQRELATFFLAVFAPQIALYGLVALAEGLLNAHGRFALPTFVPIANNVIVIAIFLVFTFVVSGTPTDASVSMSTGQKWLLGAGTTAGVAAMAIALVPALLRLPGARLRPHLDLRHPVLRKLARLSAWTVVYVLLNTVGLAVSFYLAGALQGGVTAYTTAFAFFQLPIGIAAISIVNALLPKLSAHAADGENRLFRLRLAGGVKLVAVLMLPTTALLALLADPLVRVLLEHGVVKGRSAHLVATTLTCFAIGLLPFAAFQLCMRAFYARQDARTPALINIVENAVTIGLDIALYPLLDVRGLALAHGVGYVAGTALAWRALAGRLGGFDNRALIGQLARIALASTACGAATGAMIVGVGAIASGELEALGQLALGGTVGLGVFLAAARALQIEDLGTFSQLIPHRRASAHG